MSFTFLKNNNYLIIGKNYLPLLENLKTFVPNNLKINCFNSNDENYNENLKIFFESINYNLNPLIKTIERPKQVIFIENFNSKDFETPIIRSLIFSKNFYNTSLVIFTENPKYISKAIFSKIDYLFYLNDLSLESHNRRVLRHRLFSHLELYFTSMEEFNHVVNNYFSENKIIVFHTSSFSFELKDILFTYSLS